MELQNNYDGKSEGECRKEVYKDHLKRLFCRNGTTFYCGKYVTKTKQTFNAIENYNILLYEEDKVRQLLCNINIPSNYFRN